MEARLTEFSYGYCVTEELANGAGAGFKSAPYFPSLYAEGKQGGGFDVQLGKALFLQFKLSDELTRRSANETKLGLLQPMFYRFSLHRRDHSTQHQMLIDLEAISGNVVCYIAPGFAELDALDAAYNTKTVVDQSGLFSPTDIGPLPDNRLHTVAFRLDDPSGWFCSDPKKIRLRSRRDLIGHTSQSSASLKTTDVQNWLRELAFRMRYIIREGSGRQLWTADEETKPRHRDDPLEEVEYLARTRFGCEFFLLARHREE